MRLGQLIDGIDPVAEKRQRRIEAEQAAKTTFQLVAEEYIQKIEREGRSPATIKKARWFLDLLAELGKRPIASINPCARSLHVAAMDEVHVPNALADGVDGAQQISRPCR